MPETEHPAVPPAGLPGLPEVPEVEGPGPAGTGDDARPALADLLAPGAERRALVRRALRSGGLVVPDDEPVLLGSGSAHEVYGLGRWAVRVESGAATDAELAHRLAGVAELAACGVPVVRPQRPVPLRAGTLRLTVWERVANDGPVSFEALGDALRRLHHAPLWCVEGLAPVVDPDRAAAVLEDHAEVLGDDLGVLLATLSSGAMSATLPERCCHGELDLHDVLWDAAGPHLADWDSLGRASSLVDLARVALAVQAGAHGTESDPRAAFESGYGGALPDAATAALVAGVCDAARAADALSRGDDHHPALAAVRAAAGAWS